jgi:multicomponent Na+:H+ antiporter subunit E
MRRLPLAAVLVVVWLLLWDEVTPNQVLAGIVVAVILLALLPGARRSGARLVVRPLAVVRLAGWFGYQFVISNAQVVRAVLLPRRWVRTGVVRVQLRTTSPTLAALVANTTALAPGMQPVGIEEEPFVIQVHVLSLTDVDQIEATVQRLEDLIRAAFDPDWPDDPDTGSSSDGASTDGPPRLERTDRR